MHHSLIFAALLAVTAPVGCGGEVKPSTASMKEQLHAVIRGQLEAFRTNDFAAAYKFAAEEIRTQFPIEEFEKMVRTGYATIAANDEAVFGLTLDDGDRAVVNVRVVGADKKSVNYQYLLQREGDTWRIGGVVPLRENAPAV